MSSINPLYSSQDFMTMIWLLKYFLTSWNFQSSRRMTRECVQNAMKNGPELTEESAKFIHPG